MRSNSSSISISRTGCTVEVNKVRVRETLFFQPDAATKISPRHQQVHPLRLVRGEEDSRHKQFYSS